MRKELSRTLLGLVLMTGLTVGCGGGPPQAAVDKPTYDKMWDDILKAQKAKNSKDFKIIEKVIKEHNVSAMDWQTACATYGTPDAVKKLNADQAAHGMAGGKGAPKGDIAPPAPK